MKLSDDVAIVDPHIHLWDPKTTPREASPLYKVLGWNRWVYQKLGALATPETTMAFFGNVKNAINPYLPENYQEHIRNHNIKTLVHVQAGWHVKTELELSGETQWLEELFTQGKSSVEVKLGAIVGQAHLEMTDLLPTLVEQHKKASSRFVGIRNYLAWSDDPGVMNWGTKAELSKTKEWRQGFEFLSQHNLSFDAFIFHTQLGELNEAAQSCPSTQIILDHIGTPIGIMGPFAESGHSKGDRDTILKEWREGMARLSENKNVAVKISGMFMPALGWGFHTRSQPPSLAEIVDRLQPIVDFVIEQFGADRCMFASNFPVDDVSLSYTLLYDIYKELVQNRSENEQKMLFAENAERIYKI